MAVPIHRQVGEGEQFWFAGGGLLTMKATPAETSGAYALFEDREVRGKAAPLHLHPGDDEIMYVLEGEIRVHIDGEDTTIGAGGVSVAPRGVPHAFMVTSDKARLLCLTIPGTGWAEVVLSQLCEPAPADAIPGSRPADMAKLREVADRTDTIEILGPPPFAPAEQEATAVSA